MKIKFEDQVTKEIFGEWELNAPQEKFWMSDKKFVLFSGGFGSGKSLALILKGLDLLLKYPKNYILMGRRTYRELEDSLIKEFFDVCPRQLIKEYFKAEKRVVMINGSELIFRHLDTIADSEIRSMNLGAALIDQAEDIPHSVFLGLQGRLRRKEVKDGDRRIYLTCNPALSWLFRVFKQSEDPSYGLVESSTLDNRKNLPQEYIDNLMNYPESYQKQYVYGIWDEELLSDKIVFAREYIQKMMSGVRQPIQEKEGLKIYVPWQTGHQYQMGIDVAEGSEADITEQGLLKDKKDSAVITIIDITAEEEAASWSGRLNPEATAEKAIVFARLYQPKGKQRVLIIPEMNSMGMALVNRLSREDDIMIYRREEYDKRTGHRLEKLGWRTTRSTKPLLVSRFQERLRLSNPIIHSAATLEEFKTFIYSDEARKSGMGAQTGFHDDRIMSLLLAFWTKGEISTSTFKSATLKKGEETVIRKGKIVSLPWLPKNRPQLGWTIC